jgi:hypothetical protein
MPTNGTRIRRKPLRQDVPTWAERLLAGERPAYGTLEHADYAAWLYFGDTIPGLPAATSPEGRAIDAAAREPS